jgi:hypothetical protein
MEEFISGVILFDEIPSEGLGWNPFPKLLSKRG